MSRNHTRIVRTLRDVESNQNCKNILKAKGMPYGAESDLFSKLEETNSQYEEKLANLKKFTSKSKTSLKTQTHMTEWIEEKNRLQNLAHKLESNVMSTLETVLIASPDASELYNVIHARDEAVRLRKVNESEITSQLYDLKQMLLETRKAVEKQQLQSTTLSNKQKKSIPPTISQKTESQTVQTNTQEEKPSETPPQQSSSSANSIIAELLLNLRESHNKQWQKLRQEELKASAELATVSRRISAMMRDDQISEQDNTLKLELQQLLQDNSVVDNLPMPPLVSSGSSSSSANGGGSVGPVRQGQMKSPMLHSSSSRQLTVQRNDDSGSSHGEATPLPSPGSGPTILPPSPSRRHHSSRTAAVATNTVHSSSSISALNIDFELEMIINEWYRKIATLDNTHRMAMQCRDLEKSTFCNEIHVNPESKTGDWNEADHEVFCKIVKKAQVTGMLRKVMVDILTTQLPHIPLDSILLHEEWHRKIRSINSKYRESEQVYLTTRADMIQSAKQAVIAFQTHARENAIHEYTLQQQEQRKMELHSKLHEMRVQKEQITEQQQIEFKRQQDALLAQKQVEADVAARERAEKKALLAEYHAIQTAEALKQRQEAERAQAKHEAEIRRQIEINKPKVEKRAQLLIEKEQKQTQREAELAAEETRKMEMLMRLAEQVPYYEAIQHASSKLDHITTAARGHEYTPAETDPARGHIPMNGFTDKKVISDSRFRLVTALRAAGIQNSEAARVAVQQFCPRPQLAIHGLL